MPEPLALLSLPLFPLGTMLFPGGLLPLRIFEVRYLDMIGKCYKAGAPFGVVTLIKGSEVRRPNTASAPGEGIAQETFLPVGTLATITELTKPQAGLMEIRCTGTQRFRITETDLLKHGLWVANVALIEDDQPVGIPDDLKGAALALAKLVDSLYVQNIPAAQMPLLQPYRYDDCGWVANRWCELLPLPPTQKQGLLALESPLLRLELISDELVRHGITT